MPHKIEIKSLRIFLPAFLQILHTYCTQKAIACTQKNMCQKQGMCGVGSLSANQLKGEKSEDKMIVLVRASFEISKKKQQQQKKKKPPPRMTQVLLS